MNKFTDEGFPYKKEFIDPDKLWLNLTGKDYAELRVVVPSKKWISLPGNVPWLFVGKPTALIMKNNAYENVNIFVDYFSEIARVQAHCKGHLSPYNFYFRNYYEILTEAKEMRKFDETKTLRYYMREALYGMTKECTTFKLAGLKILFKYLKSSVVLDPSSGWGDRILAAAAANIKTYHGVDPNTNLRKPYDDILNFLSKKGINENHGYDYNITTEDFLSVELGNNKYDTVLTSPPFYDHEIYSKDVKQSVEGITSLNSWLKNFYYPYLQKAYNHLSRGGYFVLYVMDTKTVKFTEKTYRYVTDYLKAKFYGVIGITPENFSYAHPLWIWRKP